MFPQFVAAFLVHLSDPRLSVCLYHCYDPAEGHLELGKYDHVTRLLFWNWEKCGVQSFIDQGVGEQCVPLKPGGMSRRTLVLRSQNAAMTTVFYLFGY